MCRLALHATRDACGSPECPAKPPYQFSQNVQAKNLTCSTLSLRTLYLVNTLHDFAVEKPLGGNVVGNRSQPAVARFIWDVGTAGLGGSLPFLCRSDRQDQCLTLKALQPRLKTCPRTLGAFRPKSRTSTWKSSTIRCRE